MLPGMHKNLANIEPGQLSAHWTSLDELRARANYG
jgi:hypothetical protein